MLIKFARLFSSFVSFALITIITGFPAASRAQQVQGAAAPVPSRIVAPVDESVRTTIKNSVHPLAQAQFDVGPLDGATPFNRMILVLGTSPEQEHAARTLIDSQQTQGSPDYHRWITPEEFGARFGPSAQDLGQVTAWLEKNGFSIGSVAKSGRWIEFSGTSAQVEAAFHTQMRQYQVHGENHIANSSEISLPAALTPVVKGVSLHNFFAKPRHSALTPVHGVSNGTNPNATLHDNQGNVVHALAPGDFAKIYDINPLYGAGKNGSGQSIAIVARSDIDLGDMADFQSVFGLPSNPPNVILNGPDPGDVPGDDVEATLDVEWSNAVAPGATIDIVISAITATTDGVDLSAIFIVENNLAPVASVSFNLCEQLLGSPENTFINALEEQAAAQGISVFVAAGDDGPAACDDPNNSLATGPISVGGLASPPWVTAVGGTEFNETVNGGNDATYWSASNSMTLVSVLGYVPEMVWNESCSSAACGINANLFAGSGGVSTLYPTPSWQASTGIPGLSFSNRALPDVSLAAASGHDGYLFCFQRVCQGGNSFFLVGGTSASSPSMAGIMAIIDQKTGSKQGLANYVLYSIAKGENFNNCNSSSRTNPATGTSCSFNDITVGNNTVPGATGFNATAGFDLATGLGSVDANNVATAFASQVAGFQGTTSTLAANPAANPINIIHGASVNFNVSVARMGTVGTPSGAISLIAEGGNLPSNVGVAATTVSGSNGTATGTMNGVSNLPGGTTYNLIANYPGDGTFGSSDSAALTVTVAPEGSATNLTSIIGFTNSGVPIVGTTVNYGDFLDLRTVVTSSTHTSPPDAFPSGGITLLDNGVPIGSLSLDSEAQSEFIDCFTPAPSSAPCLTVGSHPISISYGGDGLSFTSSSSATTTITINKGNPTVAISAPASTPFGTALTATASVQPTGTIFPSGTVQFFQGATALGSPVTLSPGNPSTASAQVTLAGSGNQSFTAQYSGDSTYNSATSAPATVTITVPFNFSATSTSQIIAAGGTATYNVNLNGVGGFTGQVSLSCTGAPGGSNCAVTPNPANLSSTTTSVPLTVTVSNTANAHLTIPLPWKQLPFVFAGVLGIALVGLRRKPRQRLLMLFALLVMAGTISCGGGGGSSPRPPTIATLTVTATSGGQSSTITLNLTITH
jgi:large repetitive protein